MFILSHKKSQNVFDRFKRRDEIITFKEEGVKESLESELNSDIQLRNPTEKTDMMHKNESDIEEVKDLEHSKSERISEKFDSNPDINYKEEEEFEPMAITPEDES